MQTFPQHTSTPGSTVTIIPAPLAIVDPGIGGPMVGAIESAPTAAAEIDLRIDGDECRPSMQRLSDADFWDRWLHGRVQTLRLCELPRQGGLGAVTVAMVILIFAVVADAVRSLTR